MKLKIVILLSVFLIGIGNNKAQNYGAAQEIKDKVAERFNEWLKKGEFEKKSEYQERIKFANDTLKKFTEQIVDNHKKRIMRPLYGLYPQAYDADSETYLLQYRDEYQYRINNNGYFNTGIIKVSPKIAKNIGEGGGTILDLFPKEVQVVNDKWVITKGIILISTNGRFNYHYDFARREYMSSPSIGWISLKKSGEKCILDVSGERPCALNDIAKMADFSDDVAYYEWNITDQPKFNPASIQPITLNLEDLNIILPASQPTVTTTAATPQEPDLNLQGIQTSNSNPDAIAVVIGNKDYQSTKKVAYAISDVETMKQYLTNVLGYKEGNILYVENATKSAFETMFGTKERPEGKLAKTIKPSGVSDVFIYYSGHGAPGIDDHKGYFVPVDCDPQYVELGGYSLDLFYQNIAKLPARSITVVTDACFSGAELFKDISPIVISISNPVAVADNCVVLSSSAGSQVSSWYNDKKHGLFTYFFLRAFQDRDKCDKNKDGKLSYQEIFDYISDKTEGIPYYARKFNNVEQTPTIEGSGKENILVEFK